MKELGDRKYRIEEFIIKMTVAEKSQFLRNLLGMKKENGKNLFSDHSRLYKIRASSSCKYTNMNATSEQLKAILKELNDIFPEEEFTIENIYNIPEAVTEAIAA